jgi:hypothetical protein
MAEQSARSETVRRTAPKQMIGVSYAPSVARRRRDRAASLEGGPRPNGGSGMHCGGSAGGYAPTSGWMRTLRTAELVLPPQTGILTLQTTMKQLSDAESYALGILAAGMALLQVAIVGSVVSALLNYRPILPIASFMTAFVVVSGIYFAADLVIRYAASESIDNHAARSWSQWLKVLGPIGLFILWWRYLRPRRA